MSEQNLRERFAIAPWTDLDWDVGAEGLVAMNLVADDGLQRDILSVLIARRLGNKSIDYTSKIYAKNFEGHKNVTRR